MDQQYGKNGGNFEKPKIKGVLYGVEDVPAPHLCFLFGLQQAVMCVGSALTMPYILSALLCAGGQEEVLVQLMGISLFMCGVATLLQTTIGVRLPIIQGGSYTFVAPIAAMMMLDKWKCPDLGNLDSSKNATGIDIHDPWKLPLREIQGNLMLASVTQVIVGCSGLAGLLMRFIGPLTIAPTISLIGLSLTGVVASFCEIQWGIAAMTAALLVIFSTILNNTKIPLPSYSRLKGCHINRFPFFGLFPVILGIGITWLFSFILTEADVFTSNSTLPSYSARTDTKDNIFSISPWFSFPLPFPFGTPSVSMAGYVGMLAATLSSIVESIGDYLAAARISEAPPPPHHALNRGIAVEGFASIISGIVGAGHATTSYSGNIGEIAITKVASRRAFQTAAVILIVTGIFTKFGAVLASIPDPIIGGSLLISLGLIISIGISSLQFCDLSSLRNLVIIGMSFMAGLMIPNWLQKNPDLIDSGSTDFDQVILVLGGTASFVGGFFGCLLDNVIPGTDEERGIKSWRKGVRKDESDSIFHEQSKNLYEFPFVMKYYRKIKFLSYFPISPTFSVEFGKCSCNNQNDNLEEHVYEQEIEQEELRNISTQTNMATPEAVGNKQAGIRL